MYYFLISGFNYFYYLNIFEIVSLLHPIDGSAAVPLHNVDL